MKNKKMLLLLATLVFALLVFVVISCKKEYTCFTVSDRDECKKKCGVKLFSQKMFTDCSSEKFHLD